MFICLLGLFLRQLEENVEVCRGNSFCLLILFSLAVKVSTCPCNYYWHRHKTQIFFKGASFLWDDPDQDQ